MKKRWLFIPLSVALLTLVVTGGALLAQGSGTTARQSIIARVAELLDRSEAEVQGAFDQATREHQDAAIEARLSRLVENEKISLEDAKEISEWFVRRPDQAVPMLRVLFLGEEALQHRLSRMEEYEKIAEEDADAVMDWYQERPAGLENLYQFRKQRGQPSTDEPAGERVRPSDRQPGDRSDRPGPRPDGAGNFSTDGAIERFLNRLVEQDKITQADMDVILTWITDKPNVGPDVGRWVFLGEGLLKQRLDRMVESGRIEQGDADAVLEWFRSKPAGIQALNQFLGHRGRQPTDRPSDSQLRPSEQNRGDRFNGPELRRQDGAGNLLAPALQDSL